MWGELWQYGVNCGNVGGTVAMWGELWQCGVNDENKIAQVLFQNGSKMIQNWILSIRSLMFLPESDVLTRATTPQKTPC